LIAEGHIIDKVFLEVQTRSEKEAIIMKDNISDFLHTEIFPALENLFDEYGQNEIIRFEKLAIDLMVADWNNKENIKEELLTSVKKKLENGRKITELVVDVKEIEPNIANRPKLVSKQLIDQKRNKQAVFLFFLKNGCLPWYGRQAHLNELTELKKWEENLDDLQFLNRVKALLKEQKYAVERMVFQFANKQVLTLLKFLDVMKIEDNNHLQSFVEKLNVAERNMFLHYLLRCSIEESVPKNNLLRFSQLYLLRQTKKKDIDHSVAKITDSLSRNFKSIFKNETYFQFLQFSEKEIDTIKIEELLSGAHLGKESEEFDKRILEGKSTIISQELFKSEREKEQPFFEKSMNSILVQNAGLVLFHPFISQFFKNFKWLSEKGKIKSEFRYHAVQTLHFIATGNEDFFEDNMLLEKFLCGISLTKSVPVQSLLNAGIKEEANKLLESVIMHWEAIGNTSPAGLREGFVLRDGKLIRKDNGYKLVVERKTLDILLDQLPWNISLVKLPWKDELLYVEW